jgi:hypothetical protein
VETLIRIPGSKVLHYKEGEAPWTRCYLSLDDPNAAPNYIVSNFRHQFKIATEAEISKLEICKSCKRGLFGHK